MQPITILAAATFSILLVSSNALQSSLNALAVQNGIAVPALTSSHIYVTSSVVAMSDDNLQLTYPRVCLYSTAVKNTQIEKFRSLSGTVAVVAEIWASANLLSDVDTWIHYYVEAVTSLLRENIGDWGNGLFFSGAYDVQLEQPKAGGLGFIESAKLTCSLNVSRN